MLRALLSHLRRYDYHRDLKNIAKVAGVAEFQNVAGVAVLSKCCQCCSV